MVARLPTWTKAVRKFQRNFHSGNFHRLGTGHGRPVLEGVAFAPVEMNTHHTATPHRGDALAWERGVIAIRTCIHVCAYSALHYTAFHYIEYNTFHDTTLHCDKLHYTSLHHIAVHFATLHYTFTTATLPYISSRPGHWDLPLSSGRNARHEPTNVQRALGVTRVSPSRL